MKALQIINPDGTPLSLVERDAPSPGPDEILVKVRAVALNRRDLGFLNRSHPATPDHPITPCSDMSGRVVAVGANVTGVELNTPMVTAFLPRWDAGFPTASQLYPGFGGPADGVASQFRVFRREDLIDNPPAHLNAYEAACLPCAGVTAWNAIQAVRTPGPGDHVVIPGSGGVSVFALQFARAMGATVISLSSDPVKAERLRALGAAHVLDYRSDPNWSDAVRRLTGDAGAVVVLDFGAPGAMAQSLRAVGAGGVVSVVGGLGDGKAEISATDLLRRAITLKGISAGSHADMRAMFRFIDAHQIRPVHEPPFDLDRAAEAFDALQQGRNFGKLCISMV